MPRAIRAGGEVRLIIVIKENVRDNAQFSYASLRDKAFSKEFHFSGESFKSLFPLTSILESNLINISEKGVIRSNQLL
jgi:hypothetical protein